MVMGSHTFGGTPTTSSHCLAGHPLQRINGKPSAYPDWFCDGCGTNIPHWTQGVANCPACMYDLCLACCPTPPKPTTTSSQPTNGVTAIIRLQSIQGTWALTPELLRVLGIAAAPPADILTMFATANEALVATVLALVVLKKKYAADRVGWQILAEKAHQWLRTTCGVTVLQLPQLESIAAKLL